MSETDKLITTTDVIEEIESVKKKRFGEVKIVIQNGNIESLTTAVTKKRKDGK